MDCEPADLVTPVLAAMDQNDLETAVGLLDGVINRVVGSAPSTAPDPSVQLSLMNLSKVHPTLFCNNVVTSRLFNILWYNVTVNNSSRPSVESQILAANLLARTHSGMQEWPYEFMGAYLHDAMNERLWVDQELCATYVANIAQTFGTRTPASSLLVAEPFLPVSKDSSDSTCVPKNRFLGNPLIEKYIADAIENRMKLPHKDHNFCNFIRFLWSAAGFHEVRRLCVVRLELWMYSKTAGKYAQQLLAYICCNIKCDCPQDIEVLAVLIKLRLNKPLNDFYMLCLKEMIISQPDIVRHLLKLIVEKISSFFTSTSAPILDTMFKTLPDQATRHLAKVYREYIVQPHARLRALREFLRHLLKALTSNFDVPSFCKALLNAGVQLSAEIEQAPNKKIIFWNLVDFTCHCMVLSGEEVEKVSGPDVNDKPASLNSSDKIKQIQLEALSWMYDTVPYIFGLQSAEYNRALLQLLLLETPPEYTIPMPVAVKGEILKRLILIGITEQTPCSPATAIDLIVRVVQRAAAHANLSHFDVPASFMDIIDLLFSMAEYRLPADPQRPMDYEAPKFAEAELYWKVWIILLIISAHNLPTVGSFCWANYPIIKMLIEMCIANQYGGNDMATNELQIATLEREEISHLERILTRNDLSRIVLMNPMGPARKVPAGIVDVLRTTNENLKLGIKLCRSRNPDFVLEIIAGSDRISLLAKIIRNRDRDFKELPLRCLCKYLLSGSEDAGVVNFLRSLVLEPASDKETSREVIEYILQGLCSPFKEQRRSSLSCVQMLVNTCSSEENEWLRTSLPRTPHFSYCLPVVIATLRSACLTECSPALVMPFAQFVCVQTQHDPALQMMNSVIPIAKLIVERPILLQHIIPTASGKAEAQFDAADRELTLKCLYGMLHSYVAKLETLCPSLSSIDYTDLVMVRFSNGQQMPLHLNIFHALIVLLTRCNELPGSIPMLDFCFPVGSAGPRGVSPSFPHQEVQLFPDWLKLRMLASPVERLVNAVMFGLPLAQIVAFAQNFGISLSARANLLACLDRAFIEQFETTKNIIHNKTVLARLIAAQQSYCDENGHKVLEALEQCPRSCSPPFDVEVVKHCALRACELRPRVPRRERAINRLSSGTENKDVVKPKVMETKEETLQALMSRSSWGRNGTTQYCSGDGVLCEWISKYDPELTLALRNSSGNLIFSKSSAAFSNYLFSLICHETDWETIISTIHIVLTQTDLDSSKVLDFLEVLTSNPKIADNAQRLIALTERELQAFTNLLLDETSSRGDKLCLRVQLLRTLTNESGADLIAFVDNVLTNPCAPELKRKVLQQLYIAHPSIRFSQPNCLDVHTAKLEISPECAADKVPHCLVTCWSNIRLELDFTVLSNAAELLLFKLAACHPALLLRQLGLLATLMKATVQLYANILREEHHLYRLEQVLDLLKLLQDNLFEDAYKNELQILLECYLTLLKKHCQILGIKQIVKKFTELLHRYARANPTSALEYAEKHAEDLKELAGALDSCATLQQLVQGIALCRHQSMLSGTGIPPLLPINRIGHTAPQHAHIRNLISAVKFSRIDDVLLGCLGEIEQLTLKEDFPLHELYYRFLDLILSPDEPLRCAAYKLLIQHLKRSPSDLELNKRTYVAYVQCLRGENTLVAVTAVEKMVEISAMLQEHVSEILRVALDLEIRHQLDTSAQIKEVFRMVGLQCGV